MALVTLHLSGICILAHLLDKVPVLMYVVMTPAEDSALDWHEIITRRDSAQALMLNGSISLQEVKQISTVGIFQLAQVVTLPGKQANGITVFYRERVQTWHSGLMVCSKLTLLDLVVAQETLQVAAQVQISKLELLMAAMV